jgi:hypothetical protein
LARQIGLRTRRSSGGLSNEGARRLRAADDGDPRHVAPPPSRRLSRRPGRPSKLTPAVEEKLLGTLRLGNFRSTAARFAGISPATFYRAMADHRPRFREFREAVEQAEATAEVAIIGNIVAASRTHPDVALKFAARRWPERWGPKAALRSAESDAVSPVPSVTTATITIPADQVPEFVRQLFEAKLHAGGES